MSQFHDPEIFRAVLEALRAALERAHAEGRRPTFLEVLYSDSTTDRLSLPPPNGLAAPDARPAADSQQPTPATVPHSPALRERILEEMNAAERPLQRSAIARRIERSYTGHFRQVLRDLLAIGELVELAGGALWPAGRPLPADRQD
jgi:hypothetical protein